MNTSTKSQFHFMHFRNDEYPQSGATIAILPVADKPEVLVGISYCAPGDQFNKKIGREIASGRINAFLKGRAGLESYVQTVAVPDMSKMKETVAKVLEQQELEAIEEMIAGGGIDLSSFDYQDHSND